MGYCGNRKGQFTSIRELRWTGPDTEGGFQVSRQGEQGEQGDKGNKGNKGNKGSKGSKGQIMYISRCLSSVCMR
jgi:hypothetical protein